MVLSHPAVLRSAQVRAVWIRTMTVWALDGLPIRQATATGNGIPPIPPMMVPGPRVASALPGASPARDLVSLEASGTGAVNASGSGAGRASGIGVIGPR